MIHIEVAITPSPLLEGSVKDDRQVYTAPLNIVLDRIVCDISWGEEDQKIPGKQRQFDTCSRSDDSCPLHSSMQMNSGSSRSHGR
ncbi:hypothetical protein DTO166G4_2594 [Paecilomyces variotii]|nr:hypothetical protein DTO166G4_2594 [Paecilomyces variotii]KAJ9228999.1 hypothetical protein DTO169E5_8988 [Paecilomyces variotii]KAJ9240378.1 hypothetical protein DTO166G5_1716 [Paecilomyces variotii]KAJ9251360.1 hypothetical protein DTO207G8_5463 [Paecilomyces variotii]KAJ9261511.1 hypothetical protein DTO195F2_4041 [Paecilomyces variotii]